jgi:hypothetical protein
MLSTIVALDAPRWVHYGQIYVTSPGCADVTPDDAFANHQNGLCGTGVAGGVFLVTGLHTGYVHFRVEIHSTAPPIEPEWEEIVESSCVFSRVPVFLEEWAGENKCELPLAEGTYRVRYCAMKFGEAPEGNGEDGEQLVEHYVLHFWPAPHHPDAVVKQTSQKAAYWNGGAWHQKG